MRNQTILVDINKETCKILKYKQYDNNNILQIIVEENYKKINLNEYVGFAFFELPSGLIIKKECEIEDNVITIIIDNNVLSEEGKVLLDLTLSDGEDTFTLFRINLVIEGTIDRDEAIIIEAGWDIVAEIAKFDKAEERRVDYESVRIANEADRQNEEMKRIANEKVRVVKESDRQNEETKRIANENVRVAKESERLISELERQEAEASRVTAEQERVEAENIRAGFYEGFNDRLDSVDSQLAHVTNKINSCLYLKDYLKNEHNEDYSLAFNDCLKDIKAGGLYNSIKLGVGALTFKSEINTIDVKVNILGEGVNETIIEDLRTTSSDGLFRFASSAGASTMSNLTINGRGINGNAIKLYKDFGWDAIFDNLQIGNYNGSAIDSEASDTNFKNILINSCGTNSTTSDEIKYAIHLNNGCNMNHFINLHVEHCRHMVKTSGDCFMNYFTDCKFEQSGQGINVGLEPVIYITSKTLELGFTSCTFVPISINGYLENNIALNAEDVPYFIKIESPLEYRIDSAMVILNSCISRTGAGSNVFKVSSGFSKLLDSYGRVHVNNCHFSGITSYCNAIRIRNNSIFTNNTLNIKSNINDTNKFPVLVELGAGMYAENSIITNNIFYGMFTSALNSSYCIEGTNLIVNDNKNLNFNSLLREGTTLITRELNEKVVFNGGVQVNKELNILKDGKTSITRPTGIYTTNNDFTVTFGGGTQNESAFILKSKEKAVITVPSDISIGTRHQPVGYIFSNSYIRIKPTDRSTITDLVAGIIIIDSKTFKLLIYDGANWRDAMGSIVY